MRTKIVKLSTLILLGTTTLLSFNSPAEALSFVRQPLQNQTGKEVSNLKLTFDRFVGGGGADSGFNSAVTDGRMITYSSSTGATVGPLGSVTSTTFFSFGEGNLVSGEWSFPENPDGTTPDNQRITGIPKIKTKDNVNKGKKTGQLRIENDDSNPILVTNFMVAKDVPSIFFGTSESELAALNENNLFIDEGEFVSFPPNFSLAIGESITFDLGAVNDVDNYIVANFDIAFASDPDNKFNIGHASRTPVPEPSSTLSFLALGTLSTASILKRKLKS